MKKGNGTDIIWRGVRMEHGCAFGTPRGPWQSPVLLGLGSTWVRTGVEILGDLDPRFESLVLRKKVLLVGYVSWLDLRGWFWF